VKKKRRGCGCLTHAGGTDGEGRMKDGGGDGRENQPALVEFFCSPFFFTVHPSKPLTLCPSERVHSMCVR